MGESIFTSQTPANGNENDSTAYTLCTLFTPAVDGTITHGRWFFPATLPSTAVTFALFARTSDASGTELVRKNFSSPSAGAWNTVALDSPISVSAGSYYYAAVRTPDRYVATGGFFSGSSVASGNLTAPADDTGTPRRNGRFNDFSSQPEYPDTQFNGGCYFADVVFEAASGSVSGAGSSAATSTDTLTGLVVVLGAGLSAAVSGGLLSVIKLGRPIVTHSLGRRITTDTHR